LETIQTGAHGRTMQGYVLTQVCKNVARVRAATEAITMTAAFSASNPILPANPAINLPTLSSGNSPPLLTMKQNVN
jgi:phage tail protein X